PIVYNADGSAIVGIKQSLSAFQNYTATEIGVGGLNTRMGDVIIPINRVMLMNTGGSSSQALGVSPLVGCYRGWREKIVNEQLEVVGAR
ncbi:hypothetical protein ACKRT4_24620, partial [Enterobacter cloacae subsp. cloacae]